MFYGNMFILKSNQQGGNLNVNHVPITLTKKRKKERKKEEKKGREGKVGKKKRREKNFSPPAMAKTHNAVTFTYCRGKHS